MLVVNSQIIILIVVVSLFFGANSGFATEIYRPYVSLDEDAYKLAGTGTITLHSSPANKSPSLIDFAYVHVSSDSDKIGLDILVIETFVNTRIFSGDVKFGTDTDGGASLKTNVGDLVYVEFNNLSDSAKILSSIDDESSKVKYLVVTTDKESYSEGEIVQITGEVRDLYPHATLTIKAMTKFHQAAAGFPQEVTVGADKKFSTQVSTYELQKLREKEGTYTIEAVYQNSTRYGFDRTTFDFYPTPPSYWAVFGLPILKMLMMPVVVAGIGIGIGMFVIKRRKFSILHLMKSRHMSENNNSQNENSQSQNKEKYSKLKNELDEAENEIDQIKDKQELETRRKRPTGIKIMSIFLVITGLIILIYTVFAPFQYFSFLNFGMFDVFALSYLLLSVGIFIGIKIARISAMIIFTMSMIPLGYNLVLFSPAFLGSSGINIMGLILYSMMAVFVIFIFYLRKSNVKSYFVARSKKSF